MGSNSGEFLMILRQADEDRLIIDVDPLNRPGRYYDLPTENPRTGIYDKVSAAGLLGSLIDLPDRAISRLNVTADKRLPRCLHVRGVRPQIRMRHQRHLLRVPLRASHTHGPEKGFLRDA